MIKRKKHTAIDATSTDSFVCLNTPIADPTDDILGFKTYVKSIKTAINSGAQMIAVTSPFGAGKSSVAELLKRDVENKKKVVKVSMWSHLCNMDRNEVDTIDLHRNFLYQLVSKINKKSGTYISRRLSNNYGLLKLHTERKIDIILTIISIVLFILGYVFPEILDIGLPVLFGTADMWNNLFVLISIICMVIVIVSSEIVFSSKKSECERKIDTNEIIELYQKFVLNQCRKQQHIVIIEDLDRTDNNIAVIEFLKELRKYYVQHDKNDENSQHEVVFVVNVKQESAILSNALEHRQQENESLYAKLFDYILNIQTINIADYETVLESILQQNSTYIKEQIGYDNSEMTTIPGMQWIIHGRNFGIRDIKDRLNKTFTLYESLKNRFASNIISLEKCAIVAYLTTTYEEDFIKTDDNCFGKLVELHIKKELQKDKCASELKGCSKDYIDMVYDLIVSKNIDSNYRMYFYNYPQNSSIPSYDEISVQNAILYNENVDGLFEMAKRVAESKPEIIYKCFDKISSLNLPIPNIVFKCEPIYIEALRYFPEGVFDWIENLDYSENSFDKTCKQLLDLLNYDIDRKVILQNHIDSFCVLYESNFTEDQLLHFRNQLCELFSWEINMYESLFMGVHALITKNEMDCISLDKVIPLINLEKNNFDIEYVQYVVERFVLISDYVPSLVTTVKNYLFSSLAILPDIQMAPVLLKFMIHINTIIEEFEEMIVEQINTEEIDIEQKDELFSEYQKLVNITAKSSLSKRTLENINLLGRYSGFDIEVARQLLKEEFVFDSVMVKFYRDKSLVEFGDADVIISIKNNREYLLDNLDLFYELRKEIVSTLKTELILEYKYLFTERCPVMTKEEFELLRYRVTECYIMDLIPAKLVTSNEMIFLREYFCRKHQYNSIAIEILNYISKFEKEIASACFYSLDFESSIKYNTFSKENKELVKEMFYDALMLDSIEKRLSFMSATKFLDSTWEEEIIDDLITDDLQKKYIEIVNESDPKSISSATIKCICSFKTKRPLKTHVTDRLFNAKKYEVYVVSKALYDKEFILATPDKLERLWSIYISIFASGNYKNTCGYMDENMEFLKLIMEKKEYIDLTNERRMVISKIYQDSDCLTDILKYGDEFALEYYSNIAGFLNEAAATTYINLIENNEKLLKSDDLYVHTYDKLVSSVLKSKYTRARKKYGYL